VSLYNIYSGLVTVSSENVARWMRANKEGLGKGACPFASSWSEGVTPEFFF